MSNQTHRKQTERSTNSIDTEGGAYIEGGVSTGGGHFVGRDKNIQTEYMRCGIRFFSSPNSGGGATGFRVLRQDQ